MQIVFACPKCERPTALNDAESARQTRCSHCDWVREREDSWMQNGQPTVCFVCGCEDLWRQKDFPVRVGLAMVVLGGVLSTIAWSMYQPLVAIGILMFFAVIDLLLFLFMRDVLVCYRCGARHRHTDPDESFAYFNLEKAEQYRQEAIREKEHAQSENSNP